MRYQKVVNKNGVETARYNYVYADGQLILLSYTANGTTQNAKFIYSSTREVLGFIVDGVSQYLYVKNLQGDVVAIVNESGVPVVRYIYDAWGNVTITTDSGYENLINLSPFAYRGYCYDNDIKMYYLQSRYYDPQICRFINADSSEYLGATGTVLSCNLFAYCENDPVDKKDLTGYFPAVISTIFSAIKVAKTIYDNFLCVRLYCWGFTHRKYKVEAYDVSSNWKNLLVKRMKGSKAVGDYLKEQIKLMNKGHQKMRSCDVVISFYNYIKSSVSDLDLTLAVGAGGSFKFYITKTNEKENGKTYYKITAKLIDEVFNFEYWKINIGKKQFGTENPHSSSKLVTIINNTGYFTQKCGAFIPFTWKFAVSYKILY